MKLGFVADRTKPCVFVWREKGEIVVMIIYVEDIIWAGNDDDKLNELKTKLESELNNTGLGEPKYFLRILIEIKR